MAPPGPGEVLVQTLASGISAGTELLIYRGEAPADLPADASLPALSGTLDFPVKYGYAAVGRVIETGSGVEETYLGRTVFAFQPHQTYFVVPRDQTITLPQPDDTEFGVPYGHIDGMTPDTIPDVVKLMKEGREADTREYIDFNLIGEEEMGDPKAALDQRLSELGRTHDIIAVGDGPSPETSRYLAVFCTPKTLEE